MSRTRGSNERYNIGAKVKQLRLARKMTLQAVARETGFSPALISQIEHENVSPPIATLAKLAKLFNIGIGQFFAEEEQQECYEVGRAADRIFSPKSGLLRHGRASVASCTTARDNQIRSYLLTLTQTEIDHFAAHNDCEKFLYIVSGSATVQIEEHRLTLDEGDSVYLDPRISCGVASTDGNDVTILTVVTRQLPQR